MMGMGRRACGPMLLSDTDSQLEENAELSVRLRTREKTRWRPKSDKTFRRNRSERWLENDLWRSPPLSLYFVP